MNVRQIIQTAKTYWSIEDDAYITESTIGPSIAGDGDTGNDSFASFIGHVYVHYGSYKEGKHSYYNKEVQEATK